MSLLYRLGLLGLIGIIVLILIYIIKPNYLQKVISSTFMWKRSLKYRKKRVPINRLQNILIFLCQFFILAICGLLLAKPVIEYEQVKYREEKIIILDASASMRMTDGSKTRFERAIEQIRELSEQTLSNGGKVSIILADEKADQVDATADNLEMQIEITELLNRYLDEDVCTFGSADIKGAVALSEELMKENSEAEVVYFTATEYTEKNGITVMDVSDIGDWNAAVLDVRAVVDENNHIQIEVDLGCFGKTEQLTVSCNVKAPNGKRDNHGNATYLELHPKNVNFIKGAEEQKTVVFTSDDFNVSSLNTFLYSFETIEVRVEAGTDSFQEDNTYFVYGGEKPTIKIQYVSTAPNDFFDVVLRSLRDDMKNKWKISITKVSDMTEADLEGFDFYIFEHVMPTNVPTDGVVLLVDPTNAPDNAGFRVGSPVTVPTETHLEQGVPHAITKYIKPEMTTIAKYIPLQNVDSDYQTLINYGGNPIVMLKETLESKIMVWALDLHYSSLIADPAFSLMLYNTINHFMPVTFSSHSYVIGDTVDFNARATELTVRANSGEGDEVKFETFPAQMVLKQPGAYTTIQPSTHGDDAFVVENFFVTVPSLESNITKTVDALPEFSVQPKMEKTFDDLLVYFAAALTALLFLEWWLHSREHL